MLYIVRNVTPLSRNRAEVGAGGGGWGGGGGAGGGGGGGGGGGVLAPPPPPLFCKNKNKFNKK